MSVKREDLVYWVYPDRAGEAYTESPTDFEFDEIARAEGYVKLDVDTLDRLLSEWFNMEVELVGGWTTDTKVMRRAIARQVLAALDGEDT